jgi:hypothetical protein
LGAWRICWLTYTVAVAVAVAVAAAAAAAAAAAIDVQFAEDPKKAQELWDLATNLTGVTTADNLD